MTTNSLKSFEEFDRLLAETRARVDAAEYDAAGALYELASFVIWWGETRT